MEPKDIICRAGTLPYPRSTGIRGLKDPGTAVLVIDPAATNEPAPLGSKVHSIHNGTRRIPRHQAPGRAAVGRTHRRTIRAHNPDSRRNEIGVIPGPPGWKGGDPLQSYACVGRTPVIRAVCARIADDHA